MKLLLSRRGMLTIRQQIVWQIEMKILTGELSEGQKLPSVRALARQLEVAPRTVLWAYEQLVRNGNIELRRGSGAFVGRGAPRDTKASASIERGLGSALAQALREGWSPHDIRSAVRRWLEAAPPDRVVIVDMLRETAELMVRELGPQLTGTELHAATLDDVTTGRLAPSNAVYAALHFHAAHLEKLVPEATVVGFGVDGAEEVANEVRTLPHRARVLVVSHSPRVLQYAKTLLQAVRGDDVTMEFHPLHKATAWSPALATADFVLADILSAPAVERLRKEVRVFRIVGPSAVSAIREALALPAPRAAAAAAVKTPSLPPVVPRVAPMERTRRLPKKGRAP